MKREFVYPHKRHPSERLVWHAMMKAKQASLCGKVFQGVDHVQRSERIPQPGCQFCVREMEKGR